MKTVLLFGSPRSGTTWLGKMFDSHPRTLYRHEPDSVLRADELPLFVEVEDFEKYATSAREYAERVLAVRTTKVSGKLPTFGKDYFAPGSRRFRNALIVGAKLLEGYFGQLSIPDFVSRSRSDELTVVWKSIESNGRLGLFARSLPHVRVIHIVRHPCGTIASVLRGENVGGFVAPEPASEDYGIIEMLLDTAQATSRGLTMDMMREITPVERLAWIWGLSNEKAMEELRDLEHCRTVRYEDLCAAPDSVCRDLFAFTGLDWNRQSEQFIDSSVGREDARFHSVFKNPQKSANKWKEELSQADQDRILSIAQQTLPGKLFSADRSSI